MTSCHFVPIHFCLYEHHITEMLVLECDCVFCVCVCLCGDLCCGIYKNPNISHATFMTLKQGIMGLPGVYDQHTHMQLSLAFIGFYLSDCWCISPSHGKKRLFVTNRWKTFIHVLQKCSRHYKTSDVWIPHPNNDPKLGKLKCTMRSIVSAEIPLFPC